MRLESYDSEHSLVVIKPRTPVWGAVQVCYEKFDIAADTSFEKTDPGETRNNKAKKNLRQERSHEAAR